MGFDVRKGESRARGVAPRRDVGMVKADHLLFGSAFGGTFGAVAQTLSWFIGVSYTPVLKF